MKGKVSSLKSAQVFELTPSGLAEVLSVTPSRPTDTNIDCVCKKQILNVKSHQNKIDLVSLPVGILHHARVGFCRQPKSQFMITSLLFDLFFQTPVLLVHLLLDFRCSRRFRTKSAQRNRNISLKF